MHTPSLEEFELEDLSSDETISDEELAEQAMQEAEPQQEQEAQFSVSDNSVAASEEDTDDPSQPSANTSAEPELLQRMNQLIGVLEMKQTATQPSPEQQPSKQFAKAVQFVKTDKNHYLGAKWFRKAAMQGHAKAQLYLGLMFLKGEGLPKSFFHAYSWLSISACQDLDEAKEAIKKLEPHMTAREMRAALKHAAFLMESILES
ncbi:MAG: tetratricopeptide repeat protein [Aestuariibacter sp.]